LEEPVSAEHVDDLPEALTEAIMRSSTSTLSANRPAPAASEVVAVSVLDPKST
jgi:hypothetical protein